MNLDLYITYLLLNLYSSLVKQKRFYTRGTLSSIRISRLAIISILYRVIDWDPRIKKKGYYLSCLEGKGVWKTFIVLHKMPRYLLIYYEVSFSKTFKLIGCKISSFQFKRSRQHFWALVFNNCTFKIKFLI